MSLTHAPAPSWPNDVYAVQERTIQQIAYVPPPHRPCGAAGSFAP